MKLWLTFNEPYVFSVEGYEIGVHAPGIKDFGFSCYAATHTILKAHAKAYHAYDQEFRPTQQGKSRPTQQGKSRPTQQGKSRPTQQGKSRPTQQGKSRPTQQGKSQPTQQGKSRPTQQGK